MRRGEVITGLILTLVAFSYVASILLDFRFVSPYASPQEDVSYLSESIDQQLTSSIAWMITAVLSFLAIPSYMLVLGKASRTLQVINALLMMGASVSFLMMALSGLQLHREMAGLILQGTEQFDEETRIRLLEKFSQEQWYRRLGSTCVGLWAMGLGLLRVRIRDFPIVASILLIISGPVMVFFNWYDPEHVIRTGAMAGIIIGVMIVCARLINRGVLKSLRRKSGRKKDPGKTEAADQEVDTANPEAEKQKD
jgi:hypothetical protein